MLKGLYAAYSGMIDQQKRMDVVTNNLANSTTVGFKKEGSTSRAFRDVIGTKIKDTTAVMIDSPIGKLNLGVKIGETYTDYSQGAFRQTDNTFDLALAGDGYFNISYTSKSGKESTMYTRDGSFTLTNDGYLVTKDGDFVLSESGGKIMLPTNAEIKVDELGNIFANGEQVSKLKLTDFEDYNHLEKFGENMYRALDSATVKTAKATINQGYLEQSNVQVVSEMVEMITIQRAYEAAQKAETAMDGNLEKAVTLGQVK